MFPVIVIVRCGKHQEKYITFLNLLSLLKEEAMQTSELEHQRH
jgi:hypothetical protein